jgi:hypothetical protein
MRASLLMTSLRVLTLCCVILLAILSLLPDQQMVRTGLPGRVERFVAYAGSAAIAMAGYGATRGGMQIIGDFGYTPPSWNISSTSRPVGTQRSGISRHRRLGRCAAVLL